MGGGGEAEGGLVESASQAPVQLLEKLFFDEIFPLYCDMEIALS